MSGETAPKTPKVMGRGHARNLDAGPFQPMIASFELHLRAEKKSSKTIRTYTEAAQWMAASYLVPAGVSDWSEVTARHVQEWTVTLLGHYSDCYANNRSGRCSSSSTGTRQRIRTSPALTLLVGLKPPKVGDKLVPVFSEDELAVILATCKGGGFHNRRDYAVISLFKDAGIRLSELAGLVPLGHRRVGQMRNGVRSWRCHGRRQGAQGASRRAGAATARIRRSVAGQRSRLLHQRRHAARRCQRPPKLPPHHQGGRARRQLDAARAAALVRVDHE
jgi:hypothetical protein